jgi:hypothetical protein
MADDEGMDAKYGSIHFYLLPVLVDKVTQKGSCTS